MYVYTDIHMYMSAYTYIHIYIYIYVREKNTHGRVILLKNYLY